MTYITVETPPAAVSPKNVPAAPRTAAGALIMVYRQENARLKERIAELEAKIDRLIDDKERMLRDERDRIESIYAARDEQLKAFLELVNTKLVQENFKPVERRPAVNRDAPEEEAPFTDVTAQPQPGPELPDQAELLFCLDAMHYTPAEKKTVKKRFARAYGNDIRVIQQNGEFILDFSKYDYADLLAR